MKTPIQTLSTLAGVVLLTGSTLAQTTTSSSQAGTSAPTAGRSRLEFQIEQLLDSARFSYKAIDPGEYTPETSSSLMERILAVSHFQLEPGDIQEPGHYLLQSSMDPSAMLHVDAVGRSVIFNKGVATIRALADTPGLPGQQVAPQVAQELLGQLGMLPGDPGQVFVQHVGGLGMGVHDEAGITRTFEKLRTVRFGRKLDGLPVEGRGSRIQVQLGSEGALWGLVHRWNEVLPIQLAPADRLDVGQLTQMFWERVSQMKLLRYDGVKVDRVELVLYDDGEGVIEPVLRCQFRTKDRVRTSGTGEIREVVNPGDFYLPVLRETQLDLPYVKDITAAGIAQPQED